MKYISFFTRILGNYTIFFLAIIAEGTGEIEENNLLYYINTIFKFSCGFI